MPPDLRDWLPAEHLLWFVSDLVDALDLRAIEAYYDGETRGQPTYHPRLMVKLLLYGYCQGVRSSRKIAQRLDEDVAFRALAARGTGRISARFRTSARSISRGWKGCSSRCCGWRWKAER